MVQGDVDIVAGVLEEGPVQVSVFVGQRTPLCLEFMVGYPEDAGLVIDAIHPVRSPADLNHRDLVFASQLVVLPDTAISLPIGSREGVGNAELFLAAVEQERSTAVIVLLQVAAHGRWNSGKERENQDKT